MAPQPQGYQGYGDGQGNYNRTMFIIKQVLATVRTAQLVIVKAVNIASDGSATGSVDVQVLTNQVDPANNATPHGIVNGLPYFRLQGGACAVIIDPVVGDIGLAIFADRDISTVKKARKISNPGSNRKFDIADGLYIGGYLNAVPTRMIKFASDGTHVIDPTQVFLDTPIVSTTGELRAGGNVTANYGGADQVGLDSHKHPTAAVGAPSAPTPGT